MENVIRTVADQFEIASPAKLKRRFMELGMTAPKIFMAAFLWQGFGLACGCNPDSSNFYFMTGFGSAVGTFVGHVVFSALAMRGNFDPKHELLEGVIYAMPIFLGPGTAWQKIVNDCQDWGFNFDESFCYMWLVSFLILICSLCFLRILNERIVRRLEIDVHVGTIRDKFPTDFQIAMSIGFGDAFFMGTVPEQFSSDFLAPPFGVYDDTPPFEAMVKAGGSTLCGFLIMQTFQNFIWKKSWLDPKEQQPVDSAQDAQKSNITGAATGKSEQDARVSELELQDPVGNGASTDDDTDDAAAGRDINIKIIDSQGNELLKAH